MEDEQHLANGLRFNLEAEGYQVSVVETGESAIETLTAEPDSFDVMVLDVMLPGKDGFDVMSDAGHQTRNESREFVDGLRIVRLGADVEFKINLASVQHVRRRHVENGLLGLHFQRRRRSQ